MTQTRSQRSLFSTALLAVAALAAAALLALTPAGAGADTPDRPSPKELRALGKAQGLKMMKRLALEPRRGSKPRRRSRASAAHPLSGLQHRRVRDQPRPAVLRELDLHAVHLGPVPVERALVRLLRLQPLRADLRHLQPDPPLRPFRRQPVRVLPLGADRRQVAVEVPGDAQLRRVQQLPGGAFRLVASGTGAGGESCPPAVAPRASRERTCRRCPRRRSRSPSRTRCGAARRCRG